MRSRITLLLSLFAASFHSCQNIEGTEDPRPTTYIKVFEGPNGYTAASFAAIDEGFVILGNTTDENNDPAMVLFKVDHNGNRVSEPAIIGGGNGYAIKPLPQGGFVIAGDSIFNQSNPENVNDFQIFSSRLFILNEDLNIVQKIIKTDESNAIGKTDYRSTSITVTPSGKLILLGTYQESDDRPIKPFISTFSNETASYQENWYKPIALLDQDYQNAKSVFYNEGKITWATAIANEQQNFNFSYVSIPTLQEGSVYANNSLLGSNSEQLFLPSDIYPYQGSSGYGVIGTYGSTTRTNKNIFFVRVDANGSIVGGTEKYFDAMSTNTDKGVSQTEDTGEAIVATSDNGFLLAGTVTSIPDRFGNGERDIVLIKTDHNGDPQWSKTIGGTGDEVPRVVHESADGSLMIFGTNTVGGFPSIFLIKVSRAGEL